MDNFQRAGSISNSHVGRDFENLVYSYFVKLIPSLRPKFQLMVGHKHKKVHNFDFGNSEEKAIIECKSHTWTKGDKMPSAKLTTWDQAMYYFHLAPYDYRKIFVVKKDISISRNNETLCSYYLRTHFHLIPEGVEFWEVDETANEFTQVEKIL
ncbi:MAG: hypothetical protein KAR47_04610 [Planctomycetes bacterium]|nr:hypothetical protein [Planctomycetota bacterium]